MNKKVFSYLSKKLEFPLAPSPVPGQVVHEQVAFTAGGDPLDEALHAANCERGIGAAKPVGGKGELEERRGEDALDEVALARSGLAGEEEMFAGGEEPRGELDVALVLNTT